MQSIISEGNDIKKKEKGYKSYLNCFNCGYDQVPNTAIISIAPLKLKFWCSKCAKKWKKDFEEVEKESFKEKKGQVFGKCLNHQEKECELYCKKCKLNFCIQCKKDHESCGEDSIVLLHCLPSKEEFVKIIKEAKEELLSYNAKLEEICIQRAEEEIKNIKEVFRKNNEINLKLIKFAEFLEFNYHRNVYESIENLIKNTKFTLKKIDINNTNKEIVRQVESNYIYKNGREEDQVYQREITTEDYFNSLRLKSEIRLHNSNVCSICLLKDGRLASASSDCTIKVFNIETCHCDITIEKNTKDISYICVLKNGYLASALTDNTISLWEINENNYKCVKVLNGHTDIVTKVIEISNNRICSCSYDHTLIIWKNSPPFHQVATLKCHSNFVRSIIELKNKSYIISAGSEEKIKFWDSKSYHFVNEIDKIYCANNNSLLEISNNRILVGEYGKVTVIDGTSMKIERKIETQEGRGIYCFVQLWDGTVLCGDGYPIDNLVGNFIHLDVNNDFTALNIKHGAHEDDVNGLLLLKNNYLISCSKDKSIKIWE